MADQIITITIPDEKTAKALEGFLKIYPNTETNEQDELIYTDRS